MPESTETGHKQPKLHTTTALYLNHTDISYEFTVTVGENSILFRRYLKHLLRMTNTKDSYMPTWKQQQYVYQLNQKFHGSH